MTQQVLDTDATMPTKMQTEHISDDDRFALELAKSNKKLALVTAEKALAQHESAEVSYKYVVLQLFMKYGLSPSVDLLNEDGSFIRGGLVKG